MNELQRMFGETKVPTELDLYPAYGATYGTEVDLRTAWFDDKNFGVHGAAAPYVSRRDTKYLIECGVKSVRLYSGALDAEQDRLFRRTPRLWIEVILHTPT